MSSLNSYTCFTGNSGLEMEEDFSIDDFAYTVSIWFRPSILPWEVDKDFTLFSLVNGNSDELMCSLTEKGELLCEAGSTEIEVRSLDNYKTMIAGTWHLLTLRSSRAERESILYLSTHQEFEYRTDREGRSLPNQDDLTFDSIRIGIEKRKRNGFEGCLSRFQMYGSYLSDDQAKVMAYSSIRPNSIMVFQILLTPNTEEIEYENTAGAVEILGDDDDIFQTVDLDPNFDCSAPSTMYRMLEFNGDTKYEVDLDNVETTSSFSIWFWRYYQPSDQTLISRGNQKLEATFDKDTFDIMDLEINRETYQLDLSHKYNMWLNLVVLYSGSKDYQYGLYDSDGNELYSGDESSSTFSGTVDEPLEIGEDFKGFIRGVMVTEEERDLGVQYDSEIAYQTATKFAASFIQFNWQGKYKMKTFGSDGGVDSIQQSKRDLQFRVIQFRDQEADLSGTVDATNINFDGITCSETNQSLYFQRNSHKAQFDIENFKESPSLTFEMWVRGKNPFRSTGFIFSMSQIDDRDKFYDTFMAIETEGNQVVCTPFLTDLASNKLVFEDTSNTYDYWQHISCSYSLELQTVAGHYFYDNKFHSYYQDLKSTETKQYLYPSGVYRFCVNCMEGGKKRGQSSMYYKELRLWYSYRTQDQIIKNRFQQVGTWPELFQMVAYHKFMSIGNVNYANFTSPAINIDADVTYQSESRLTVCPMYTFHNQFNENEDEDYKTCYADPISDPFVVILHDEENKEWTVTAEYTFFVSDYASENYAQFIAWKWEVDSKLVDRDRAGDVEDIINAIDNSYSFTIPESLVTSDDRYVFNLYLFSTHGLFTTKEYKFDGISDQECDVYDKFTGQSFQQVEISDERGEKDQYLYVNITESDNYYVKDKDDIIFRYSLDSIKAVTEDLNEDNNSLRIKKSNQDDFPMNQFVSVVVSIKFTHRQNKFISFNKVMIYEVAFVFRVVPVVKAFTISDSGIFDAPTFTETQTVLKNRLLRIDARESYITNWDFDDDVPALSFKWICPEKLQRFCNQEKSFIDLESSMIREAGFQNGDVIEFSVEVTSGVVKGQEGRSQTGTILLDYFNVDLDVDFKMSPKPYDVKKFIAVTAQIDGYTDEIQDKNLIYSWSVEPFVPEESIPSGLNSKQLVFGANTLEQGIEYDCTLTITLKETGTRLVRGKKKSFTTPIEVISRPLRSDFKSGLPFIKQFEILAQQPKDNERTQFFFLSEISGTLVPLSGFQGSTLNTFLPMTKQLHARYFNDNQLTNLSEEMKVGIDFKTQDSQALYEEFYRKIDSIIVTTSWEDCMVNVLKLAGSLKLSDSIIGNQRDGDVLIMKYREDLFNNIDIILDSYPQSRLALSDSLDSYERANIVYMTLSAFRQMTHPELEFSMKGYKRALDKTFWLWENREKEMETILTDSWFPMATDDYLGFLSNLLDFVILQSEEQQDYLDVSAFNEEYSNATAQIRELVSRVEVLQAQRIPEGIDFQLKVQSINMMIKTYSSVLNHTQLDGNFLDELSGSKITFPIHRARKSSDRVTVSVTAFGMSPFFGSRYKGDDKLFAVITPVAFSVNYRDENMNLLGTKALRNLEPDAALDTQAFIDFEFENTEFNKRFFNKDVSFCAPFDEEENTFLTNVCEYQFRLSRDQAFCSCSHLSYFTLVEDYDDRKPPIAPTFKDIPFVIATIYLIVFVLIGGLVFTINKDKSQKKEIEEANKDAFRNQRAVYTLNAIAFYRNDIALSLISEENQTEVKSMKLFQLYYQMLHPLSSLYFSFDPSLPKIFYFLVLYLRIMLIYSLSFAMFKDHTSIFYVSEENHFSMAILMTIAFSLLLIPLPFWALSPCRNKHFLSRSREDNDESSEEEDDSEEDEEEEEEEEEDKHSSKKNKRAELKARLQKLEDKNKQGADYLDMEKVFVSLNLPLRLMFLINTNKTEDLISHKVSLAYADGDPEKVVDQIFENNNKKEQVKDTEMDLKRARERIKKGKKSNDVSDDDEEGEDEDQEIGPENVKVQMEGGDEEKKEEGKKEEEDSEEEELKNKEVLQEAEVKKLIFRLMLFGIVFLFLLIVIAQAVSSEIGQELYMESEWLFFYVFFGAQILGFVVVDSIAIIFITMFMLKSKNEDRKRQVCIAKCCWQAFVWKSDYKFALDVVKAKR